MPKLPTIPPVPEPGTMTILWSHGDTTQSEVPSDLAEHILELIADGRPFSWSYGGMSGAINPSHVMEATWVPSDPKP